KTRDFVRAAKLHGLTDVMLTHAIDEVRSGLIDAALGDDLIKKRITIGSRGKSAGLRTVLIYRTPDENVFCLYAFAKSELENLTQSQLKGLKSLAKILLSRTDEETDQAIAAGELQEVIPHGDKGHS